MSVGCPACSCSHRLQGRNATAGFRLMLHLLVNRILHVPQSRVPRACIVGRWTCHGRRGGISDFGPEESKHIGHGCELARRRSSYMSSTHAVRWC